MEKFAGFVFYVFILGFFSIMLYNMHSLKKTSIYKSLVWKIAIAIFAFELFIHAFSFLGWIITDIMKTKTIKQADGFTISSYNVILDVKEDNQVFVTEEITVDWEEEGHHGIFKFTPEWLKYTGKNGKTISRKSKVKDLKCQNEPYTIDQVKNKPRIKIGHPDKYVSLGKKVYIITYNYDMGKDPFFKFDEFIFHAYGDYWGTEIKNATLEVRMPKSIQGYNINFFVDKYRRNNVNNCVNYNIEDNILFVKFDAHKYYLDKALTIDIELPEGYFAGGSWNYGWWSFILSLIIFFLTTWTIFKWYKYGKNFIKRAQTVEFYPPENLSSAEIGYIYNKRQPSKKLTISLIIELASKNIIKIDELNDKFKNIQITNLYPKYDKDKTSLEQKMIAEQVQTKISKLAKIVYDDLFREQDVVILSEHQTFYKTFDKINQELVKTTKDKVFDKDATKQIKGAIVRNILILILSVFSYSFIKDLDPHWYILYILSFLCIFINLFFVIIMGRKTQYGELIMARIKGFRYFLLTAEKNKLEELVQENPRYFYNILPYTYVLGISQKWIKKFEDIPYPKLDIGNVSYDNFDIIYDNVYYPSSSSSSSGGCSSCGGGCSSCGGGCSSCGGGGSW